MKEAVTEGSVTGSLPLDNFAQPVPNRERTRRETVMGMNLLGIG
jgi:hypothetical protein